MMDSYTIIIKDDDLDLELRYVLPKRIEKNYSLRELVSEIFQSARDHFKIISEEAK